MEPFANDLTIVVDRVSILNLPFMTGEQSIEISKSAVPVYESVRLPIVITGSTRTIGRQLNRTDYLTLVIYI